MCHDKTRKTYERACLVVGAWGHEVQRLGMINDTEDIMGLFLGKLYSLRDHYLIPPNIDFKLFLIRDFQHLEIQFMSQCSIVVQCM